MGLGEYFGFGRVGVSRGGVRIIRYCDSLRGRFVGEGVGFSGVVNLERGVCCELVLD